MKKTRIVLLFIVIILIFLSTFSTNSVSINNTNNNNQIKVLESFNLNIDLKARVSGGEWQDLSLTVDNREQIEFKLGLTSSGGGIIVVVVLFPCIGEEPMMKYQSLSTSHNLLRL